MTDKQDLNTIYRMEEVLTVNGHLSRILDSYNEIFASIAKMCSPDSLNKTKSGAQVTLAIREKLMSSLQAVHDTNIAIYNKRTSKILKSNNTVSNLLASSEDIIKSLKTLQEKETDEALAMAKDQTGKYKSMVVGDFSAGADPIDPAQHVLKPETRVSDVMQRIAEVNREKLKDKHNITIEDK